MAGRLLASIALEAAFLGALAGLAGVVIVVGVADALGALVLHEPLVVPTGLLLLVLAGAPLLSASVGGGISWQACRVRPLEILRYE